MPVIEINFSKLIKEKKWNYLLKAITVLICSVFFFGNNFFIFEQFISHKTYYASKLKYEDKLLLPNIVICNASAYRNPKVSTLDSELFRKNTFHFTENVLSITSGYAGNSGSSNIEKILWNSTYTSIDIQIKQILSFYRGKCFMISYDQKVEAHDIVRFSLSANSDLWIYLLFEEHEFFIHYDYWPDPMPPVIRKGKEIESQDVSIKKTMMVSKKSQSMKSCIPNAKESYIGCLKKSFRVHNHENGYPNCTTPWHQNMLGIEEFNKDKNIVPCNQTQMDVQVNLDTMFTKKAASYTNPDCAEPCEIVKYESKTLSYDKYSSLSVVQDNGLMNATKVDKNHYMYFYYSTTEVPVQTEEFILDSANFISAIGGNLGMFIGFSFLGFFSWFYDMIERIYKNIYMNK